MERYFDRVEAGKNLAGFLKNYENNPDVIILALPRGGVPIGFEIAKKLGLKLDVFIVRKLGVPIHKELAMGALASGGTIILNDDVIQSFQVSKADLDKVIQSEEKELKRRETIYRDNRAFPDVTGKTIILVDDGIATGATMFAAIKALRQKKPAAIVVAVPVAAMDTCEEMKKVADSIVCPMKPANFMAVGVWYENFPQTSDEEVIDLLSRAR